MLQRGATSDLVFFVAESPKRVSRTAQSLFRSGGEQPKTRVRTVKKTALGLSLRMPENTFLTLSLSTFGFFWLFWQLCQGRGIATPVEFWGPRRGEHVWGLESPFANRQSLAFSERSQLSQAIPLFCSTWNECYTNQCQSRNSTCSKTNAGSMRGLI